MADRAGRTVAWRRRHAALVLMAAAVVGQATVPRPGEAIDLREVSGAWGVDFRHHHGGAGERFMVETVVGGVLVLDYDGDGDPDLLFVDGGRLPGYRGETPRSRLFRNNGGGRFEDVTERLDLPVDLYGCGGTAGDYDNDGDLDVYLTAFGENQLLRNNGDGSFSNATAEAGVGDPLWSASAAFADVDRDGDLDLYVTNYVDFTLDRHKFCGDRERDLQGYCHPSAYEGLPDRFYRNRGDGTFEDATREAGFAGATEAGLGVAFADVDEDGWPDLYVANDADPNFLFRNRGDGTFEDVSLISGTAYDETGRAEGSMGVEFGDVDGDGRLDLVVANFEFETNALYKNLGRTLFVDHRFPSGVGEPSLRDLAFGLALLDLDHDGDQDLVIGNGHILDNAEMFDAASRYAQPTRVFENLGGGRLRLVQDAGIGGVRVVRGLATGDLDLDGDLDLVLVNSNAPAEVYENLSPPGTSAWLQLDLRGAGGNRFGIGARLELETGRGRQVREAQTASSYLSQDALTIHFGFDGDDSLERLIVRWPSGRRQHFRSLPSSRRLLLYE